MKFVRLSLTAIGPACAAIVMCGCASIEYENDRASAHHRGGQTCDVASSEGTSVSRAHARSLAEYGVRQQLTDVRGSLLIAGFKHIRARPLTVSCRPYVLGGGLTQCSASRQLCGR